MKFVKAPAKFYFHYPFPVAVIGVKYDERINVMSAVWHTQLSFDPPLYGILISPKRYTHSLLEKAGEFTVNFLEYDSMETVAFVGNTSGRDLDKVSVFEIPVGSGRLVDAPVLLESYAVYECELFDTRRYGDHTLFVGKIVGVHFEEGLFYGEKYHPKVSDVKPVLYIGDDTYLTTDPETKKIYGREDVKRYLEDWSR